VYVNKTDHWLEIHNRNCAQMTLCPWVWWPHELDEAIEHARNRATTRQRRQRILVRQELLVTTDVEIHQAPPM
jgi:hypothetical protein